ncbi:ATP-grasp domain-containing protein [Micromonospora arida]|uniref:ATP-grasp domain-containing protein n=1 Tax=Micromonospora arida TaxID=2203715 RepID=A0A3N9X2R1_9ACTN|nr:ATP-grasp domain-containing protein [Micromonospora arida]RQX01603.1 hypothetical protein DLJ58_32250 [Micromonospora arida]
MLLDVSGPDREDLLKAAIATGHEVYTATPRGQASATTPREVAGTVVVDFSSYEAAVSDIVAFARSRRVDAIVTVNEFLTPVAALACATLGLPGNDATLAMAARNKITMVERLHVAGVAVPSTIAVTGEEEVYDHLRRQTFSFPLVVKPAENAGSTGVSVVERLDELTAAFQRVRLQRGPYGIHLDPRVVVQEYIDGEEFSVESLTQDGQTEHVCITKKQTTSGAYRVETGHTLPSNLDPIARQQVLQQVTMAAAATGIRNSWSHCEVKRKPDGAWVVLEIAPRIGGGRITLLTSLALEIDMAGAALAVALGQPVELAPTRRAFAAIRRPLAPRGGRLLAVQGMPCTGVNVPFSEVTTEIGASVASPDSNSARVGYFIVTATDETSADQRADELLRGVSVIVEPQGN